MTAKLAISRPLVRWIVSNLAVVAVLAIGFSSGAAQSSRSSTWKVPMTSFGHPDLQGNWTNATLTPFERPRGQGPTLSSEQVAEIEQGQAQAVAELGAPSDPDRAPPEAGGTNPVCIDGPTSCYNEYYREPGERVAVLFGEARSSLVTNPSDGRIPELTPAGQARVEAYRAVGSGFGPYDHPELRPLAERCIVSFGSSAGPPMLPNYWYNNNYTIVQNPDYVMIMAEMVHDVRIIRLAEPEALPSGMRPYFGDSWGRWDGNTLVVETTNLNPEHAFRGVPPSESLKVIERFTRVDEETIHYEFTIDDPTTYASPWGGEIPFTRFDDLVYEYACHEGNYAMTNVLSGARYQEGREGR